MTITEKVMPNVLIKFIAHTLFKFEALIELRLIDLKNDPLCEAVEESRVLVWDWERLIRGSSVWEREWRSSSGTS